MTSTTATVPAQIADLADSLTGFHPALDRAVSSIVDLLNDDLNIEQTAAVTSAIGGDIDGGNTQILLALVLQQITNPDRNPALDDLPAGRRQTIRRLGAEYTAETAYALPSSTAGEIAYLIDPADPLDDREEVTTNVPTHG